METNAKNKIANQFIDLTYLKQLSNGDNNFIKEMIRVFMEQTPESMDNLEKYLKSKDWKMVRAVAHKMKPSFAFVGLKDIQGIMNTIEENADKETSLDLLPGMFEEVKRVLTFAMKELEEEIEKL